MNASAILDGLTHQLTASAGLDQHRNYLGISKISDCPRVAVREYFDGPSLTEQAYRMCFAGYEHELSIVELLARAGIAFWSGKEVVAPFDPRLRGHIDALTRDDDLLEIKSVSTFKFAEVRKNKKVLKPHFIQVQLYLRYGPWQQAFVVYRNRETYEHQVIRVPYVAIQAERYEEKARMMLRYIDRNELPSCECGRCES